MIIGTLQVVIFVEAGILIQEKGGRFSMPD